jgi:ribonucleoside-diphosphate reductase alpha chain
MLATWQKHIQSGVSKTINLSANATEEDVEKVYWQAYETNCKGITVFRDGCRGGVQVLNTGSTANGDRPDIVTGRTMKVNTALGKMYITVNSSPEDQGSPFEVFVTLSKGGTNASADAEAIGRLVSLALQNSVNVPEIVKHLKGIGAGEVAFNRGRVVSSIPDAVAYVLERMFLGKEEKIDHPDDRVKYFPSGTQIHDCKDCG